MKKLIYIFAIVAFALTSCEKNEVVKKEISQETSQKISNIVSVLKSNNNAAQSIKTAVTSQMQRIKSSDDTPVLDEETQKAVEAFVDNPQEALEQIAIGENGAEQIDLLESIYMQDDQEIILAKLKTFIPEDSISSIQSITSQSNISSFNFC
jgi:predicted small secreted protein